MADWQPIETAPKDGTHVDLWCAAPGLYDGFERSQLECRFPDCRWLCEETQRPRWVQGDETVEDRAWRATHWMPLPESPGEWGAVSNIRARARGGSTFDDRYLGDERYKAALREIASVAEANVCTCDCGPACTSIAKEALDA